MSDARRVAREAMGASVAALLLVTTIDLLTNSIDIGRFDWDFRYYIDMAERGFGASLASPFAYRYLTPMLARGFLSSCSCPPRAVSPYLPTSVPSPSCWRCFCWFVGMRAQRAGPGSPCSSRRSPCTT
jgi:hypothetical protein